MSIKTPEQQPILEPEKSSTEIIDKSIPISEPEKSPANVELDIDAAKKYLDEVYGGQKSSVIVDKSTSTFEKKELQKNELPKEPSISVSPETTQQFNTTEIADKSVSISKEQEVQKESQEKPKEEVVKDEVTVEKAKESPMAVESLEKAPTAEELAERVRVAKTEFIDLAKNINEAREKKEKETEDSLYNQAEGVYKTATSGDLKKRAREIAKFEAEREGLKLVTKKEFFSEARIKHTEDKIKQREWSTAIRSRFDALSDKEKEKYFNGAINKSDPSSINSARMNFASELENKRNSLEKKGLSFPKEVFYQLIAEGYKPEDTKKRGFFGRMFLKGAIELPTLNKTDKRGSIALSENDYTEFIVECRVRWNESLKNTAEEELERKFLEGRKTWKERKQRSLRDIIQETAKGFTFDFEAESLELKLKSKSEPEGELASEARVTTVKKEPKITEQMEEIKKRKRQATARYRKGGGVKKKNRKI